VVYVPVHTAGAAGRQRLIRKLRSAGATSEGSAHPLEPENRIERKSLERALRCGTIRRTGDGNYWLDEEQLARSRTREMRYAGIALLFMLLTLGILYVLGEIP
jgi:hypothetical protein